FNMLPLEHNPSHNPLILKHAQCGRYLTAVTKWIFPPLFCLPPPFHWRPSAYKHQHSAHMHNHHTHTQTNTHTYTYADIQAHAHTYIYTYIDTYTHTHLYLRRHTLASTMRFS